MASEPPIASPVYQFQPQIYRVNDVLGWHERSELLLSPSFQRRRVWTRQGKSYLIDSIVRGMPIPQFFIRERVHTRERRTIREVVDGQQRISTILDFIEGKFTVLPSHNSDLARRTYDSLPEHLQQAILSYPLSVNIITTSDDASLLEIFSRINAYSIPLNRPEKLNAAYTGAFKKSVHEAARRHLVFWQQHHILTNQAIARMADVDLTADLLVTMLDGLQNQKTKVEAFYKKYDEDFPAADELTDRFAETLRLTEECVGAKIEETEYARPALFYSLFAAIYDRRYGFGDPPTPEKASLVEDGLADVRSRLQELSDHISSKPEDSSFGQFITATLRSTDKIQQRTLRHSVLTALLNAGFRP